MSTQELREVRPEGYIHTTFQRRLALRELRAGILSADTLTTPQARAEQYSRLRAMIGNTPLLGFNGPNHSFILVKDESQNPTESHYDRVYIETLKRLEETGVIEPGDELYEVTSGSAGISFGWLCGRLGYKANVFVPASISEARKQELRNFGVRLVEVSEGYVPEASKEEWKQFSGLARTNKYKLARYETDEFSVITATGNSRKMCLINHSENPITPKSLEAIGVEVVNILPAGVGIDYFATILGNGSNTSGITAGLKERFIDRKVNRGWPAMQVIGVEDWDNPVQFEAKYPGEYKRRYGHTPSYKPQRMFGSSAKGTRLRFMDVNILDDIRLIPDIMWDSRMKRYNSVRQPVDSIGASSAGALIAAEQLAQEHAGCIVLTVFYDKGDRYSNPIPDQAVHPLLESPSIPHLGWRQWVPESPIDLPANLSQVYQLPMKVRLQNLLNN